MGTEPEGETWLRGRALNVGTSAVGSGACCGEVADMVGADVEVSAPCQRRCGGFLGAGCRDVSPRTNNDVTEKLLFSK